MELNALQLDVLGELANMGLGTAAASLSEMVNDEVVLAVPKVEFIARADVMNRLGLAPDKMLKGVEQVFSGTLRGHALLLFPDGHSLSLVRMLLANTGMSDSEYLNELEEEALIEVGNIILNATLSVFADTLEIELNTGLPNRVEGRGAGVIDAIFDLEPDSTGSEMLLIGIEFSVHEKPVRGFVALLLEVGSLLKLTESLDHYIEDKLGIAP